MTSAELWNECRNLLESRIGPAGEDAIILEKLQFVYYKDGGLVQPPPE